MNTYLTAAGCHTLQTFWDSNKFKDLFCSSSFALGLIGATAADCDALLLKDGHFSESKMVRQALGIPDSLQPEQTGDHNPVNDCIHMAQEYAIWMKFWRFKNIEMMEPSREYKKKKGTEEEVGKPL